MNKFPVDMMKFHGASRGFTLVELISVIVILGVLGAVVVPKFVDIRKSGVVASLHGIEAAFNSANNLVRAKAILEGKTQAGRVVMDLEGQNIDLHSGFPRAHWNRTIRYIITFSAASGYTSVNSECKDFSLCGVGNQRPNRAVGAGLTQGRVSLVWPRGYRITDGCYVYYNNPENGEPPKIGVIDAGC